MNYHSIKSYLELLDGREPSMEDCLLNSFQEKLGTRSIDLHPTGYFEQLNCKSHHLLIHQVHSVGMFALPQSLSSLNDEKNIDMCLIVQ